MNCAAARLKLGPCKMMLLPQNWTNKISQLHQGSMEVTVLGGFFVLRGMVTVKVEPLRGLL